MIREPAVAGAFYPAEPEVLRRCLEELTGGRRPPAAPRGVALVVPHAGYIYSGSVAAATYTATRLSHRVIILGPNHTGEGEAVALLDEGRWHLPFGEIAVDTKLASGILSACSVARVDARAHRREHSLEVQVPFLQYLLGQFRFVPVCVGTTCLRVLLDLGHALADSICATGEDVLLVLSSDMSHYLPAGVAKRQDRKAIDRILAIDPEGLHEIVMREGISMCGMAPVVAGLAAARQLRAEQARLVVYGNSGDRSGDYESVVGYAGVAVT